MAIKGISASRLIALLAASKMNDEEIQEARAFLTTTTPDNLLLHVKKARQVLSVEEPTPIALQAKQTLSNVLSADVATQLERLLVHEASLSKSEASRLLTSALTRRNRKLSLPNFNSKDGFRRWLNQVAECVPLGELLHAAAAIRNTRVHTQPDDWIDPDSK
ncbi:hypothetical protein J2W28_000238 [Variovorax boronicumulans]|uniref:hypothetical protein n=1 Tax=Variovorax boronicumulans TaxID=436515 RepID=UPI00277DF002|nr:hypothetical protein [Variovorax boronicumulans]MDP9990379.1 hypothetical protein [Variovorax boronicumulans]MDQ0001110.1 hypothetical protein [Variovorax boronicumulans]